MNFNRILTPAAVLATLSLVVTPAFAGQHSSGGHSSGGSPAEARARRAIGRVVAQRRSVADLQRRRRARIAGRHPAAFTRSRAEARSRASRSRGFRLARLRRVARRLRRHRSASISPFYSFRPRFSLGFGLWAGYPIAYSIRSTTGTRIPVRIRPVLRSWYYPPPAYSYPIPNPSSAYPPQNYPPANYPQSNGSGQSGYYESDQRATL